MSRSRWLLLGGIGLLGCQAPQEKSAHWTPSHLPLLQQPPIALPPPLRQDSIGGVFAQLVGRFALAESLPLHQLPLPGDSADWLREFAAMQTVRDSTTLSTDGLELLVDYHQPVAYQRAVSPEERAHYPAQRVLPVYVVNTTVQTKLLAGKDHHLFAIQEAQDRQGQWRPIESRGFDFCGNGRWLVKLHPQQCALFLVQQYQGSFATRLRVRLQNGESRYVSAPYPGQISEQQFLAPADQVRQLRDDRAAVNWLYYGAVPAALDSLEAQQERLENQQASK